MKILVTGGTGNVGGAVVKELHPRGADLRVLARKQPDVVKRAAEVEVGIGDLLHPALVERAVQLAQHSGALQLNVYENMLHVWPSMPIPESGEALTDVVTFLHETQFLKETKI